MTVNGVDQSGVVLRLEPGMTVVGRIAFEGTALQPPADLSRVSLRLQTPPSASGVTVSINPTTAQVAANPGTFTFAGVTPGRYLLAATPPPAATPVAGTTWQVKSAMVAGLDMVDAPFDVKPGQNVSDAVVTFTDKTAEVSGTLLDAAGKPTSDFSVLLFSADRTQWFQRSRRFRAPARAGTNGKFKFINLPPGDYYVAALTDFEQADLNNAAFLEQVAATGAIKITVAEGEKKTQDLRLAGGQVGRAFTARRCSGWPASEVEGSPSEVRSRERLSGVLISSLLPCRPLSPAPRCRRLWSRPRFGPIARSRCGSARRTRARSSSAAASTASPIR